MADSSIMGLFKTPEQVRAEQEKALMEQGARSAGMLLQQPTRSGLAAGILAQGAAGAQYMPKAADRFVRGMLGAGANLAGALGNEQAKAALNQASMSPEERKAREQQATMSKIAGSKDPAALEEYAQKIAQSNPRAAEAIMAKAAQLRQAALDQQKVQAQTAQVIADTAKTLSETENISYDLAYKKATEMYRTQSLAGKAAQDVAAGEVATQTVQTQVSQASANLAKTYAESFSIQTGTNKTELEMQKLVQDIDYATKLNPILLTQEGMKTQGLELANKLDTLALEKGSKLLPFEIAEAALGNTLTMEQTAKVKADTEKALAEMVQGPNPTGFMRELQHAKERGAIDEGTYDKLLTDSLEAKARVVDGVDVKAPATEFAFEGYKEVISKGQAAEAPLENFQTMLMAVEDGAATGPLAEPQRLAYSLGAVLGIDSAVAGAAANNLIDVLQGNLTLDEASALKGALSDKDLKFLQESLPRYQQSEQGLKNVLMYLASSKAGEVAAGQAFEARMGADDFTSKTILQSRPRATAQGIASVNQYTYLVRQRATGQYKGPIPVPTAGEITLWAKFTGQDEGTAKDMIELIKQREEAK